MGQTPEEDARECGWCAKVSDIAYTDPLGIDWCVACYQDTYLENWPDPLPRVIPPGFSQPPEGWRTFGSHVDEPVRLEFSDETDDGGMPLWERPIPPGNGS